jgi:NTP pyrophosphatase (non-canonical NTP hydrolase)
MSGLDDHNARMQMLDKDILQAELISDGITFIDDVEDGDKPVSTLSYFIDNVVQWHHDRNLIDGSTDKDQTLKLLQELGELSDSVCKGKDIKDDIGDMLVVMLNITTRNGVTLSECLARAWDDIKDRKGKMVDGIFVKEEDL